MPFMKRRILLGTALLSYPAGVWGSPLEQVVVEYYRRLPNNYGPGAIFDVHIQQEGRQHLLTGRVLRAQDKAALGQLLANHGTVVNHLETFPYAALGALSYGLITAKYTDMRSKPDSDSERVCQAVFGDGVFLLAHARDWYQVLRQWDGYVGWVAAHDVQVMDAAKFYAHQRQPKQMVLKDTPQYLAGSIVTKTSAPVRSLVAPLAVREARERIVHHAQALYLRSQQEHFPYVWGGTYGVGLDCSGLTQTVYRLAGIALPRDANQQQAFGHALKATPAQLDDLLPADLVFFCERGNEATHTGIYLGEGVFLHSSGKGGNGGLGRNNLQGDLPYEGFLRKIWHGAARMIHPDLHTSTQGLYLEI